MKEVTGAVPTVRLTSNALRPTTQPQEDAVTPSRTPMPTPREAVDDRRDAGTAIPVTSCLTPLTSTGFPSTSHLSPDAATAVQDTLHSLRDTVATSRSEPETGREVDHSRMATASEPRDGVKTAATARARRHGAVPHVRPDLDAKQSAHWVPAGEAGGSIARQYRRY